MGVWRWTKASPIGLLLVGLCGCNVLVDVYEGLPRGELACSTLADCTVEVPECRKAVACENSRCVFDDVIEGQRLSEQTIGDCVEIQCDGAGKTKTMPTATDVPDDGNPCTLDACDGVNPAHTLLAAISCYTGPINTKGVGKCTAGIQHCDAQGQPIGGCEGEVLPAVETCISPYDDDCDGEVNEEGDGCTCTPGDVVPCYSGSVNTENVGICHGGTQTCKPDSVGYGPCTGEQLPQVETCDPFEKDDDCDGQVNEEKADCTCGDGYLSPGEACDDGDTDSTDGCTEFCKLATCGDGFVQPGLGETCDDGNLNSTDACTASCQTATCGDGFVQPGLGEICDDGNLDPTDTCTASCQPATCGDAILQTVLGEICDDGNLDSTDYCTQYCQPAKCGDGFVQPVVGEECDDGNADSTDTCTALCQLAACGDGFLQPGESCDDGNTMNGDACPSSCLRSAVQVVAGFTHGCVILESGKLKCFGRNTYGQLGLGDTVTRGDDPNEMGDHLPEVDLGTSEPIATIDAADHTCALLTGGNVKCWGDNTFGQLGLGDILFRGDNPGEMGINLAAVNLGTGKTAAAISTGGDHTCALLLGGSVKCWGLNHGVWPWGGGGQLGLGDTSARGDEPNEMGDNLPAVDLGTGKTAIAISAGALHTCALLTGGQVKCWGVNGNGQLGLGDTSARGDGPNEMGDNLPAVDLGTGKTAIAIRASGSHTCALLTGGQVKCWGANSYGNLGLGDTSARGDGPNEMGDNLPAVDLGTGKAAIAIARRTPCTLLTDGSVKCWGDNTSGRLGLGDIQHRGDGPNEMGDNLPAVNLGTNNTAIAITAGRCALLQDGTVKCWGSNQWGQLGLGDTQHRGDNPGEMGDNLPPVVS